MCFEWPASTVSSVARKLHSDCTMLRTSTITLLLLSGLLIGACGDSVHATEEIQDAIEASRQENDRHLAAALAATSTAEIVLDLAEHETAMGGTAEEMGHSMSEMSHCRGGAMASMMALTGDMDDEMVEHRTDVEAAADLEAAMAESTAHATSLDDMLDAMDEMFDMSGCR